MPVRAKITAQRGAFDEAITQYVRVCDAELVSFTNPARGQESIATMKKKDAVFLVRVYSV